MEPTTLLQTIIVTSVPAFIVYTLFNFLYVKNKNVKTRVDEINEENRFKKLQPKIKLYKGLVDTFFQHKNIKAYVKDVEIIDNIILLKIHSNDSSEKIMLIKKEIEKIIGNTIEIKIDNKDII